MQGDHCCPSNLDCIYQHYLPAKALSSGPSWPKNVQLASGSEVLGPVVFLGGTYQEDRDFFTDCALAIAFWGSQLLLDPNYSYNGLLQSGSTCGDGPEPHGLLDGRSFLFWAL